MFCYQSSIFEPTEIVTPEYFRNIFNAPQTRWLVEKHRQVKDEGCTARWLSDRDYQQFSERMRRSDSRQAKSFCKLGNDHDRIAFWCNYLKTSLPAVMFMAYFVESEGGKDKKVARWRKKSTGRLSSLVVLDVDHLEVDPRQVFDSWTPAQRRDILFAMKSPGGHGIKVVFKAHKEWGNLADNIIEKSLELGQTPDMSGIDITRPCFVSVPEDIFYINEQELFSYEDQAFIDMYREQYAKGGTVHPVNHRPKAEKAEKAEGNDAAATELPTTTVSYGGWTGECQQIIDELYREAGVPGTGEGARRKSRHTESLKLAYDLLVMTGRNKSLVEKVLREQPWVDAIVKERSEDVHQTVEDADNAVREKERKYAGSVKPSTAMQAVVKRLLASSPKNDATEDGEFLGRLEEWGERIRSLFGKFPCLKEVCNDLQPASFPAALFVAAAFLGTDLTRTWYYFYHRPEERRRLNYSIIVIGDPTSGKSFATRLYNLLAAPLIVSDMMGNKAINNYKKEVKLREWSSKEQKKDGLKQPDVIIRIHGARNGVFIEDMNNAVETIDGEPMHLHMLTFDSELDSSTTAQKGGQWIDKSTMELKAFHNEEDSQQYKNVNSVNGPFNVYWNFVYTGTPLSLNRKVTERNFGSGLATRLAVIPMPPSGFKMMELKRNSTINHAANEELKTWAFRLDGVRGELPLWPLVEHVWEWTNEHMQVAAFNDDKADEMLLKRVAYYGIGIAAPFIVMRHWEEWQQKKTFDIDDTDRELSTLAMDIQYATQWKFFGEMAKNYFENMKTKELSNRRRPSKYDYCYLQLPDEFTTDDVVRIYGIDNNNAACTCNRLKKNGYIENIKKGQFKKLKKKLL